MKVGITEAGDPSFDYSWLDKISDMDMTILVTKNITEKFINEVLKYKNKAIIHATCTGYGGTIIEPNVLPYTHQLNQVKKLIALGFPKNQIIIRIDPIIPTRKGISNVKDIVKYIHNDVNRFRISVIDNYKHVQERFEKNHIPVLFNGNFQASDAEFASLDNELKNMKEQYNVTFESCAEPKLNEAEKIGCVSEKDMSLFGLKLDKNELKGQRKNCLCVSAKTELLSFKRYKTDDGEIYGCPNACLYCYWKK